MTNGIDDVAALLAAFAGNQSGNKAGCGCSGSQSASGTRLSLVANVAGTLEDGGGAAVSRRMDIDFTKLPFDLSSIDLAVRDLDSIRRVIAKNRPAVLSLVQRAARGDFDGAVREAAGIGLTEQDLRAKGGAALGLFVVVLVVGVLYVTRELNVGGEDEGPLSDVPDNPKKKVMIEDEKSGDALKNLVGG